MTTPLFLHFSNYLPFDEDLDFWIPFIHGGFAPSVIETGLLVLEMILKLHIVTYILLLSPFKKGIAL
jgi:hypothetical protein